MTQVILVSGATWAPSDFSGTADKVECIGPGSAGVAPTASLGGDGGGAGPYAQKLSYVASSSTSVPIQIGAGNSGTDVFFDSASTGIKAQAAPANSTTAGVAASSVGTTKFDGGAGSVHATVTGHGGGGSAGPSGAGSTTGTINGGAANNSTDAGPGSGNATAGTEFDGTHGCGPGGAGSASTNGGNGANYGGGAGGGKPTLANGTSGAGIIVINYTSTTNIFVPYNRPLQLNPILAQ